MTLRQRLLFPLAGIALVASAWGVPAYAHAHESLNDCYLSYSESRPVINERAKLTPVAFVPGIGIGNWRICVHDLSASD